MDAERSSTTRSDQRTKRLKFGREGEIAMSLLLLLVLLLIVFGGLPQVGGHQYGYAPSGIGGILLVVVLILFLTGRLNI